MFYDLSKFYDYILETINSYRFLNAQQGGTQLGLDPRSGSQWDSLNESLWQKNPEITGFSDLWSEHFSFISEISNSSFLYLVIFYFFAISAIISGFFVIVSVNPMHSVFSLVLTFLNTSIILLLLGVEFLAFLFLIVYVGAIAILFLFVVMMLNIRIVELIENTTRYIPIGLILGIIFFIELSIFKDPQAFNIQEVNISDIGGAYTFEMPRLTGLSDVVGENIREADIFEKTSPESEVSLQKAFLDPLSGTQLG